jgi:hypothetical protein
MSVPEKSDEKPPPYQEERDAERQDSLPANRVFEVSDRLGGQ